MGSVLARSPAVPLVVYRSGAPAPKVGSTGVLDDPEGQGQAHRQRAGNRQVVRSDVQGVHLLAPSLAERSAQAEARSLQAVTAVVLAVQLATTAFALPISCSTASLTPLLVWVQCRPI